VVTLRAARSRHAPGRPNRTYAASRARRRHYARRLAALLTVATGSFAVVIGAAIASAGASTPHTTAFIRHSQKTTTAMTPQPGNAAQPPQTPTTQPTSLALTAFDRHSCPAKATACVDLTRHITWLQTDGQVTFGPVRAEPGPPGSKHATPRGTFQVSWKAGPDYISNIYHEPMPWAVFFGSGGIAFHGGSLTTPSHGCVHLTTANAHYYNEHLPVGAEVVVF
jgi:lipoprotein-anchoring transpeptidase ErfK/SrfK